MTEPKVDFHYGVPTDDTVLTLTMRPKTLIRWAIEMIRDAVRAWVRHDDVTVEIRIPS